MKWKAVSRTVLTLALTTMLTLNCQQLFTTSKATVGITSVPDFSKNNTVILEAATAPQWLDPHVSYFDYDYWILQQTLETLLWYNGSSSTQVIPWLAESYTKINDTCYQFTLRQNIKFQDGTPFDATAVWFSLNRLLIMDGTSDTGNHGSQAAWIVEQMLDTNLFWAFTGSQPYDSAWVKNVLDQNFVQIMNASIVRMNVKTPAQLQFPYLLSAPWAAIISPTEVITKEYAFHGWGSPIEGLSNMTKYFVRTAGMGHTYFNTPTNGWTMGTGPYYPYSYNPTTYKAILKVNTDYWGGPTNIQYPIGTPKINEIDFNYVESVATRLLDLKQGKATGIAVARPDIFSVVDRDEWLTNGTFKSLIPGVTIHGSYSQLTNNWFNFITNVTNPEGTLKTFQPIADKRIRLAIASAVNLTDFNINVNNRLGQVANNLIPPGTAPEGAYNSSIVPPWSFNLTKAAELLVDAMKHPITSFTYYNGTPIPPSIINNSFGDTDNDGTAEISYTIEMYVGAANVVHQSLLTTIATNLNRTAANVGQGGNATGLYFRVVPAPGGQQYTLASQHRIYMYWGGWVADYNHVLDWLVPMYYSTNTYGFWNQMNYTTLDGYVQEAEEADIAGDLNALLQYSRLANQFAVNNVLQFYTFYPLAYFVRSSSLKGLYYNPVLPGEYFATSYYPPPTQETIHIRADGSVDPPTAPIQRNGDLYTLTDNIYTKAPNGIAIERNNTTLDGANFGLDGTGNNTGITLSGRSNITIKNIEIKAFNTGIDCSSSFNTNIIGNSITYNLVGIQVPWGSSSHSITENTITLNGQGIAVNGSSTRISGNLVKDNWDGIALGSSSGNSISGNNITHNNSTGILLGVSTGNNITENSITSNYYGIWLYSSSNNSIWHNNFENNNIQVYDYPSGSPSLNSWNDFYPSGGNHWSNYNGTDLYNGINQTLPGEDGIGDTPFIIDANNQDNYPLIHALAYAYTPQGQDVTATLTQDINITFNQVSSDGITSLDQTMTGPAIPTGFTLAGQYYDIKTTATYSGKITLRFTYNDTGMSPAVEENLRLKHWNATSSTWEDITTLVDTTNNVIYGETSSLSIFTTHALQPLAQDVSVTTATCSKTIVGRGYTATIDVTVRNNGITPKTFDVNVYANATIIGTQTVTDLASGAQRGLIFVWQTPLDLPKGNYTLIVGDYAIGWAIIAMAGDVTGIGTFPNTLPDGKVEIKDFAVMAKVYGVNYPDPRYVANYDIDGNGKIEIKDFSIGAKNYGKIDP